MQNYNIQLPHPNLPTKLSPFESFACIVYAICTIIIFKPPTPNFEKNSSFVKSFFVKLGEECTCNTSKKQNYNI